MSLEDGRVFVGFGIEDDLSGKSEDVVKQIVADKWSGLSSHKRGRIASQLNMLCNRMKIGDLVVVGLKSKVGRLAIGRVIGEYEHQAARVGVPHTRRVQWIHDNLPVSPGWDPFLVFIFRPNTINPIRDSETVEQVLRFSDSGTHSRELDRVPSDETEGPTEAVSIHDVAQLQIATLIHERFPEKALERLVAGVLIAEGYTIGPLMKAADQGVDVLAGYGLLGFEPPLMCVQVKHEQGSTGAAAIQQLRGAVEDFGAQQALFVSWGGYTRDAEREARRNFFRVRLWNARDLIEAVCRNYDKLPADLRAEIPIQRIWAVTSEDGEE